MGYSSDFVGTRTVDIFGKQVSKTTVMWVVVLLVLASMLLCGVLGAYNSYASTQKTIVQFEGSLRRQWAADQVTLDEYVGGFRDQFQVVDAEWSAISEGVRAAITANVGESGFGSEDAMFVALGQSYPEFGKYNAVDLRIWMQAMRSDWANAQGKRIAIVTEYEMWLIEEPMRTAAINALFGAPTDKLRIVVGDRTVYGQEALDILKRPIVAGAVGDTFESGEFEGVEIPDD